MGVTSLLFDTKNADVNRKFADNAIFKNIFRKYLGKGNSMQKNSLLAYFIGKLTMGVFLPPPPILSAYIKKPIPNRVKPRISKIFPIYYTAELL